MRRRRLWLAWQDVYPMPGLRGHQHLLAWQAQEQSQYLCDKGQLSLNTVESELPELNARGRDRPTSSLIGEARLSIARTTTPPAANTETAPQLQAEAAMQGWRGQRHWRSWNTEEQMRGLQEQGPPDPWVGVGGMALLAFALATESLPSTST